MSKTRFKTQTGPRALTPIEQRALEMLKDKEVLPAMEVLAFSDDEELSAPVDRQPRLMSSQPNVPVQLPKVKTSKKATPRKGASQIGDRGYGLMSSGPSAMVTTVSKNGTFPIGREAGRSGIANVRIHQICVQGDRVELSTSAANNGPFEGGGLCGFFAHKFDLDMFVDPTFYKNYDVYRIHEVAVYARYVKTRPDGSQPNSTREYTDFDFTIFSAYDPDDSNPPTNWANYRQRGNVKHHMLTAYHPNCHIGTFKVRADFKNSAAAGPDNLIPDSEMWWDVAAPNQPFIGLKTASYTSYFEPSDFYPPSVEFWYEATIDFRFKI